MNEIAGRRQLETLWQTVFQDSDEYVRMFFDRVYRPENTFVIEREGRGVVAMLQAVPYEVKIESAVLPCAYVCGVCTHPSERGKGYMKALMQDAMQAMRKRGFALSVLIPAEPWLFEVYRCYGYTVPINVGVEYYVADGMEQTDTCRIVPCPEKTYASYFDLAQRRRRYAVLHDAADFETIRRDCLADGGHVWVALDEERPVGMAFEAPESSTDVLIKEILYDDPAVKDALIRYILIRHRAQTAFVRVPYSAGRPAQPYGLACPLDETVKPSDLQRVFMSLMLD
ncbi:GNAT family N-acetyltransferase [Tannerella sp.]|uniref:GNAT family N-acetyltransferase n=1 Tax=Tannerella sp. TaxID=2382127 RepID=UPI0026DDBDBD|nr:GNAT family N-acetyltransferase [Tannerella sp.]MDO4703882.1 GNAT family N-acetyltransferase [Tannerella sp.]